LAETDFREILMRAFRSVMASLILFALLGSTASAQPPSGGTTKPTGGTSPSTPPASGKMGAAKTPTLPGLSADQQAQLKTEASTLVTEILGFLQITLPADEEMFLVDVVYGLLVFLTLMQSFSGGVMKP
jgi:hypothetical protein